MPLQVLSLGGINENLVSFKALLGATIASAAFSVAAAQSITLWTTEEQPDVGKAGSIGCGFLKPSHDEVVPVGAHAAAAHVIYYPLQYGHGQRRVSLTLMPPVKPSMRWVQTLSALVLWAWPRQRRYGFCIVKTCLMRMVWRL